MPINGEYSSFGLKRHHSTNFPSIPKKEKFMNKIARTLCAISFAATLVSALGANGSTARAQEPQGGPPSGAQERPTLPFPSSREPEIKPYDRVITKDAKSDEGVFTIHRVKEKIYYEIPKKELDKEFLWVSQIAKTTLGVGYGGQAMGNRVVRWERLNNRILLRDVAYDVVADPQETIYIAVRAVHTESISTI